MFYYLNSMNTLGSIHKILKCGTILSSTKLYTIKQVRAEEIQAQPEAHFILYEVWQLPSSFYLVIIFLNHSII